jgi:hypothetical protein
MSILFNATMIREVYSPKGNFIGYIKRTHKQHNYKLDTETVIASITPHDPIQTSQV